MSSPPPDASHAYQQAMNLLSRGDWPAAQTVLEEVVRHEPTHAPALHMLGLAAARAKDYVRARDYLEQALQHMPGEAMLYNNRGNVFLETQQIDLALQDYQKAVALKPDYAEAYFNLAQVYLIQQQHQQAITHYLRALEIKPDYFHAYFNLGNLYAALGQNDAALTYFQKAIACNPNMAEVFYNQGALQAKLRKLPAALESYSQAIAVRPDYFGAYNNRATVHLMLMQTQEALQDYEAALRLKPDYPEVYNNLGSLWRTLKNPQKALESYQKSIALKPDYAEAHSNLGNVLQGAKRLPEAIASYQLALAVQPDYAYLPGTCLHTQMKICDWSQYAERYAALAAQIPQRAQVISPFATLGLFDDPAIQRTVAEVMVADKYPAHAALGEIPLRARKKKIRIGYFSMDFREHAVAYLMAELFELHDRARFEVIAFSLSGLSEDSMQPRIRAAFDEFFVVAGMNDEAIAQKARAEEIDIAVDLAGYTGEGRTGIFALRAAPIQVNYLGYPGTMGAGYMDYLIADPVVIPPEHADQYTESIAYLPCFQVNDRKRRIADKTFTRQELGLPETGFVFCCFNSNYKITPQLFAVWMRILQKVPGSVLFLYAEHAQSAANLKQQAQQHQIDPARLVFGDRLPAPQYLARFRAADLFLDTLPFNAGTTASDALWAGLPVLTCQGQSFAGRMAASLLTAVGLPELITTTLADYEALAVELATQPDRLAALRTRLQHNPEQTLLFDTPAFTKNLEAAYLQMMEKHLTQQAPADMDVTDVAPQPAPPSAATMDPQFKAYYQNGVALHQAGHFPQAQAIYQEVLKRYPDHAEAWQFLGLIASQDKRPEQAVEFIRKSLALNPANYIAHYNLGVLLRDMGKEQEAIESYNHAIAVKPDYDDAYFGRGNIYLRLQNWEAALADFNKALEFKPDAVEMYLSRAVVHSEMRNYDAAIADHKKVLELNPDQEDVQGAIAHSRMKICDWRYFEEENQAIIDNIAHNQKVVFPFLIMLQDNPMFHRQAAEMYVNSRVPKDDSLGPIPKRSAKPKIKIGYFSMDYKYHPVARFILEIIKSHDRDFFEIYGFSFGREKKDIIRERIEAACDHFFDVKDEKDEDIVRQARALELDIAVDLGGFTSNARTRLFALGLAPIQINYLGYPASMGAEYIDYIVADPLIIPPEKYGYYSEKVMNLPAYHVNDTDRQTTTVTREALGLPEKAFVFCGYNNYKITPTVFSSWMRIMQKVPGSVLFLYGDNPQVILNLQKEAEQRGVDAKRLVFKSRSKTVADYFAAYQVCDLFLDTLPFNGATTASDALWAGLPVLTCAGEAFASRLGLSFLTSLDIPELITHNAADYEAQAIALATQPELYKAVKEKLQRNKDSALLFDSARMAAYLEQAYRQAMQRYWQDLPPDHIVIPLQHEVDPATVQEKFHEAHNLHRDGNWMQAQVLYQQVVDMEPRHADALHMLGVIAARNRQFEQAIVRIERSIALHPHNPACFNNLGNVYKELDQPLKAIREYDKAIALNPQYAEAYYNRGIAWGTLMQHGTAVSNFQQAIQVRADYPEAHWNMSLSSLLLGDFERGWPEYEWRWLCKESKLYQQRRDFKAPLWLGEVSLQGKRILLHSEQGLGDSLQFGRYIALVRALGAHVIVEIPSALMKVFSAFTGVAEWVVRGSDLPAFDYHCPFLSLPLAFKTPLHALPSGSPYLFADEAKVLAWSTKLGPKTQPRIGLVWSGSTGHLNDSKRSIALSHLVRHLLPGCQYISLQKEVREEDLKTLQQSPQILHFGDEITDFADTAALCQLVDVVVSVDTSVVHLAGAMGRPVWVLLPVNPDFRWLLGRQDSPWYPSAQLYRQDMVGDWDGVLQRVRADLARKFEVALPAEETQAENARRMAVVVLEQKNFDIAHHLLNQVLSLRPNDALAHYYKANAYKEQGQTAAAIQHYQKALQINPYYAPAHNNLANRYLALEQIPEALTHYDHAVHLKPDYAQAYYNRGHALRVQRRFEEAVLSYDLALKLDPKYFLAYYNRGDVYKDMRQPEAAIQSYEAALKLNADQDYLYGVWLHMRMQICDWRDIESHIDTLKDKIQRNVKAAVSLAVLCATDDAAVQKQCAQHYAQTHYPAQPDVLGPIAPRAKKKKIRLGYFSMDFKNHPVSVLMAEVFEIHNREEFEVYGFFYGEDRMDQMRARLEGAFDKFIDVKHKSDQEIAKLARDMEIDIAIDLAGATQGMRTGIFALRAAPIQINYLGYPGTMGANYFDYILADNHVIPPAQRRFYSEHMAYLPCFQANDSQRAISSRQFTRTELNLPEEGVVFCCFNKNHKIVPEVFSSWMRILQKVPGSVLFLYVDYPQAQRNLQKEAALRGVDPARLVFGQRLEAVEYLARYRVADLFLDTVPFNGGTTVSDALWAGLPVLTYTGTAFAARMAGSLLHAVGLPELVMPDLAAYEAMAIELASNKQKLDAIKHKLVANKLTYPLFQTPVFTRNLEQAYIHMLARHQDGLPPEHFDVSGTLKSASAQDIQIEQAELLYEQARSLQSQRQWQAAQQAYVQALQIRPDDALAQHGIADVYYQLGQFDAALPHYEKACQLRPHNVHSHYKRGCALASKGLDDAAIAAFDEAIAAFPSHAEAYNFRGKLFKKRHRLLDAVASYEKALQYKPDAADVYLDLGNVLTMLHRKQEAIAAYTRAIEISPRYAAAYNNRANRYTELNQIPAAIEGYARALEILPQYEYLYGMFLHTKMKVCDWLNFDLQKQELIHRLERHEKASLSFPIFGLLDSLPLQLQAAQDFAQAIFPTNPVMGPIKKHRARKKIRIGYFSMDFRTHALSVLMAELFERHDRDKFEIYAFSWGENTRDHMRQRLEKAFDQFIDINDLSDQAVVTKARDMKLDIAVDLSGFTSGARTHIFAMRAAPIQINYLGYPGTMGVDYIDYIIGDKNLIPVDKRQHYAEKIAYLPVFQANSQRQPSPRVFSRAELGLPETGVVFCCFNNAYKILPDVFDSWVRILQQVPGSVLFLYAEHPQAAENLRRAAIQRGLAPDRLVFGQRLATAEYLARYRVADLFLDTLPFNGGTTASDALWAGLPVLTRQGETFVARMAGSLLLNLDLPELVTSTAAEYEARAVELGLNPGKLTELKERLAKNRLSKPLFNSDEFARSIEKAYTQMVKRYRAGEAPDHLVVE